MPNRQFATSSSSTRNTSPVTVTICLRLRAGPGGGLQDRQAPVRRRPTTSDSGLEMGERSMSQSKSRPAITRGKYDAILFDLDGVITNTASLHAASWKQVFDEYL